MLEKKNSVAINHQDLTVPNCYNNPPTKGIRCIIISSANEPDNINKKTESMQETKERMAIVSQ